MNGNPLVPAVMIGAAIIGPLLWFVSGPDNGPVAAPPPVLPAGRNHALTLRGDRFGQFWTAGRVNGVAYKFLVDTGCNDIAFGRADARRLGFDPAQLVFDSLASTANGAIRIARVRVAWLQVGPFLLRDVPVSIGDGDMGKPLLGMSFLRHFHVAIRNDSLTISE